MFSKTISIGILLLLTVGSGFWVSNAGKPYNQVIFTIHKLIALAAVIFTVLVIRSLLQHVGLEPVVLTLIIVSGLAIIALFVTGALLSTGTSPYKVFRLIHNISTLIAVAGIVWSIFRLKLRV